MLTNNKAIEILNALAWVQGGPDREETIAAILMAIEALEVKMDGDLISKEGAIKAIGGDIMGGMNYRRILQSLPSVEVIWLKQTDTLIIANALQYLVEDEGRHELDRASAKKLKEQILKLGASMCAGAKETTNEGEWIIRTDNDPICRPWYNTCKCSKCGQYGTKVWNYCPNCGKKMRGGDSE